METVDQAYLNSIYDIPLDAGSRVARAQDMGFPLSLTEEVNSEVFGNIKPNIVGDIMYHGAGRFGDIDTARPYDRFRGPGLYSPPIPRPDPATGKLPGLSGTMATYLAENPDFSSAWLYRGNEAAYLDDLEAGIADPSRFKEGAHIYPVAHNLSFDEIFDPVEPDHVAKVRSYIDRYTPPDQYRTIGSHGDTKSYMHDLLDTVALDGTFGDLEDPVMSKLIYGSGFDAFKVAETPIGSRYRQPGEGFPMGEHSIGELPASMNLGVYDPARIRSPNARFDPRLSHLRDLLAGGAAGGIALNEILANSDHQTDTDTGFRF